MPDSRPLNIGDKQEDRQASSIESIAEEYVRFPGGGVALLRSDRFFNWAQKSSL